MKFFSYKNVLFDMDKVISVTYEQNTTCPPPGSIVPVLAAGYHLTLGLTSGNSETIEVADIIEAQTLFNEIIVNVKGTAL